MAPIDRDRWLRLEPLLDEALALPTEEQPAWLAALRASDPALAAELTALLSEDAAADRRGFLAVPFAVGASRPADAGEPSLVGMRLGAWVLERPLGQGGMGSVWLARRADDRYVGQAAIKLLHLALLTDAGQERFRREGSALARLTHPGIARLLDAGVAPGGQPYLVLEHVAGERIDRWADARALSREARVRLVLQVIDAVGHAHANLVVHRDLKPSNILVTADGRVKLLDFGIAKLLDGDGAGERSAVTIEGGRALTPEYAAPEQVRGDTVTTATDVYALGVLLYTLVSGRHPTAEGARTPAEGLRTLFEVEPSRLGAGDLDTVLARALRKAPDERYQTVVALAEDLERFLRHEPVSARRDSVAYRARRFVRRHRAGVAAVLAIAVALVAATGVSLWQMQEARRQRDAALHANRRYAAMTDLQGVLSGDARDALGRPLTGSGRIALAERILNRKFRNEPGLVSAVMTDLAGRFYEAGDLQAELAMLRRARAVAHAADEPLPLALADCRRATTFWLIDEYDSARVAVAEAKGALARAGEPDATVSASCLEAEGKLLQGTGQPDSGVVLLRRAIAITEGTDDGTYRLSLMHALAEVLRLSLRTREAVPYQRRILAEMEAAGYGETEVLGNILSSATASLWDIGELATADSLVRHYVREREARDGAGRVSSLVAFLYGHAKLRLGALDSAELWIGRALRDTTQGSGNIQSWRAIVLTQLRLDQGRLAAARAEAASLPTAPRGRRATGAMLRARLRRMEGDTNGAASLLEREMGSAMHDGQKPLTVFALPLVTAGEWRLAAGDARGADSLAREAWRAASIDALAAERSGLAGRAQLLRARARRAMGDAPGAREAARRAEAALASGYGPAHRWTGEARALLDSLGR